ncbi:MAG: peptidase S8, partial [Erythrobacter sp.]|nr:peptidase S8 [Erythrobacter sp.]
GGPRFVEGALLTHDEQHPASSATLALDRSWRGLETSFGFTWLAERDTLLGGRIAPALGIGGADTMFLDASGNYLIGNGWRIGAEARAGLTRPRGGELVARGSQLFSEAWSFDITRTGILARGDTLGLRISQPLRVSGGALRFDLPIAYDYANETVQFARQSLDLSPQGREIMSEASWSLPLWGGWASASAFHRRQPGHFADAPDDVGALVRFNAAF